MNIDQRLNKPPREPKKLTLYVPSVDYERRGYHRRQVFPELNSFDLGETESEPECDEFEDQEKSLSNDILTVRIYFPMETDDENFGGGVHFELNELLFEAAIETGNSERLRQLLAKKKDLLLTAAQKIKIIKIAIGALRLIDNPGKYENLKMLLNKPGFYPSNGSFFDENCILYQAISDPEATQILLDHDKDIFKRQIRCNYVKKLIEYSEYKMAEKALELGCDPKIENDGRNALDAALSKDHDHWSLSMDRSRMVKKLGSQYGVEISANMKNLVYFCRDKKFNYACDIIRAGKIELSEGADNPIKVALEYMDLGLLETVFDVYQEQMSLEDKQNVLIPLLNQAIKVPHYSDFMRILSKGAQEIFSEEQKVSILKSTLRNLPRLEQGHQFGSSSLFKRLPSYIHELLSRGFLPNNGDFADEYWPLENVFKDPQLVNVFREYDGHIFTKQTRCNYVKFFIENDDLSSAKTALDLGCDPGIQIKGRNALDALFALDRDGHRDYGYLNNELNATYGVKLSMNLENLIHLCNKSKFSLALQIVMSGEIECTEQGAGFNGQIFRSPVAVALYFKDAKLINKAVDIYLNRMSREKLQEALKFCYVSNSWYFDRDQLSAISGAASRINLILSE